MPVQAVTPARLQLAQADAPTRSEPVDIQLTRNKVVVVDGKESLQSAATAKPGEVLEEVATYTNKSSGQVRSLVATLPVPMNTEPLLASVKPGNALASTDGKNFSPIPLKRKLKRADGVEIEQPVPLNEYRFFRWQAGDLAAGKSLVFSARFKVSNDASVPAGK